MRRAGLPMLVSRKWWSTTSGSRKETIKEVELAAVAVMVKREASEGRKETARERSRKCVCCVAQYIERVLAL